MRKLLIGIIMVMPLLSYAELSATETHQIDLFCFDTDELFYELRNEYKEIPFFFGQTEDNIESTMSLWMRKGGESYTIVTTKKDLSCILSVGKNLKLVGNGKTI